MTDHAQPRFWSGIDIPKTLAGTLAAVSAAVAGSFLGIAGTLIGAAVVSLISSIGTEIYHRSLDRGAKKLQSAFVTAPAAVGTPEVAAAHEPPSEENKPRQIRWRRVGLVAAALFVLGLGTLTTVELLAGRSAADALTGRDGTSPPSLVNDHRTSDEKVAPAPLSDRDEQRGTEPQQQPAQPQPTSSGTAQPESTEPQTTEPAPTAPAEEPQTTEPETTTQPEQNETGAGAPPAEEPAQEQPEQPEGA
ncbi:hypothetical protein AB0F81_12000 [Actinoplanes sp. NPDC024001]|uniref:hypothetical protein n=1 Tax=Actinoplanes sp. NPDC024001 TaxID=3154598 RepID=UPI0033E44F42